MKTTAQEIRQKFDSEVELFTDLEQGQLAVLDSPLIMEMVSRVAAAVTPGARTALDVGCGAGNYSLKLLEKLPGLRITLFDLSDAMLARAKQRLTAAGARDVTAIQGDIREFAPSERFDIVVASAVLHHLREEAEWRTVFTHFYQWLNPGGSVWIFDLVTHELPQVEALMHERHGDYLTRVRDEAYRDQVFAAIAREDTPRPLPFLLDLLRQSGFSQVDVLHKNSRFAAYGALKAAD